MIAKDKLVNELKNVKLVIGNGFDLYCGLKSSYSDYFLHDEAKVKYIENWINRFSLVAKEYIDKRIDNNEHFWVDFLHFDKVSVWDLFFHIVSNNKESDIREWRWCDIETKISDSLKDDKTGLRVSWPSVFRVMNGTFSHYDSNGSLVLAGFIKRKNGGKVISSLKEFYKFLLAQLKQFEKAFGRYIYRLHYDETNKSFGIILQNEIFNISAEETIKKLCSIDNLTSIDSFNYDFVEVEKLKRMFHNINGDFGSPIFGIDSDVFEASDDRFIFSKTRRRMELDVLQKMIDRRKDFDNVVVFGHSLNKADYSYFFSLLDRMDISNLEKDSIIVFTFTVYDENNRDEIRFSFQDSISRLFHDYSMYKGYTDYPNRLLDSLTIQKKVVIREIDYPSKG